MMLANILPNVVPISSFDMSRTTTRMREPPSAFEALGQTLMQDPNSNPLLPDKVLEAYSRVRSALHHHLSPPGSFLNIRVIAERLKFSTTPVREALIRLANEEVIGFVRGRGYYTRALDADEMIADHRFAMVMIRYAIEHGASPHRQEPIVEMNAWHGEPVADDLVATMIATEAERRYQSIANSSGNRRIAGAMAGFCARTGQVRQFGVRLMPEVRRALWSLRALEERLQLEDRDVAVRIGEEHIRLMIDALPELVRNLNGHASSSKALIEDLL
ncbi:GntR family transcriptional regulator [Rhizobium sp. 16-449-1b]|uniref:GntR family transcriptional regulator n=1 Tax=Rhizobium sp. 16-449-1b TaxID=2819989 RepID=UPI001ADC5721|nr:GntR family transcriptional regulator [Rhizobium sp. 16-449-1b]